MKNYFIFLTVFLFIFIAVEMITGMILTAMYSPDPALTEAGYASSEVSFGERRNYPVLAAIISASIAFFISQGFSKRSEMKDRKSTLECNKA
ncbi:hypothetical protein [Bacillus sp. FJAT-44742]|uniref:hypothetical protein n=1 Tax=Bacillus sp. FJAT-44742 TaxID=2014005 RepID=UPI000C248C9E|nr:hypothetical protein [Bacillus sp. FJAT-44742]